MRRRQVLGGTCLLRLRTEWARKLAHYLMGKRFRLRREEVWGSKPPGNQAKD